MDTPAADKNLFMMCEALDPAALAVLPPGFHARTCRPDELDIWKRMPFDAPETAEQSTDRMTQYFEAVYGSRASAFFDQCLFVCDQEDTPIATGFAWKAYERVTTIHWLKVLRPYEGHGIGRALLSLVMRGVAAADYPVYLHTQPGSYRAIKLYSDFGFQLLTDDPIGFRPNEWRAGLPFLQAHMPRPVFERLRWAKAPADFLAAAQSSTVAQF